MDQIDTGWNMFDALAADADFTTDGKADVVARKPDGSLWLYRGNGAGGWASSEPIWLGGGWNMLDKVVSPGDFSGDGKADLIGRKPNGDLCLYKGNGAAWWLNVSCRS